MDLTGGNLMPDFVQRYIHCWMTGKSYGRRVCFSLHTFCPLLWVWYLFVIWFYKFKVFPCIHTLSFAVGMIPFRDLILQVQGFSLHTYVVLFCRYDTFSWLDSASLRLGNIAGSVRLNSGNVKCHYRVTFLCPNELTELYLEVVVVVTAAAATTTTVTVVAAVIQKR